MKWYADRKAKVSEVREGDHVIVKQAKQNKISPTFGRQLFKVKERKGGSLILQNEEGKISMRHVSAVKKVNSSHASSPSITNTVPETNYTDPSEDTTVSLDDDQNASNSQSAVEAGSPVRERNVFSYLQAQDFSSKNVCEKRDNFGRRQSRRTTFGIPPQKYNFT